MGKWTAVHHPGLPPLRRRVALVTSAGVVGALLGGCADARTDAMAAAAERFEAAARDDPVAACALLSPPTRTALEEQAEAPCPRALPGVGLPRAGAARHATLAGHSGQVRLDGDTIFLALYDDGWRVLAAGCARSSADPSLPYECTLEGS